MNKKEKSQDFRFFFNYFNLSRTSYYDATDVKVWGGENVIIYGFNRDSIFIPLNLFVEISGNYISKNKNGINFSELFDNIFTTPIKVYKKRM